jgi:hypothetical protein
MCRAGPPRGDPNAPITCCAAIGPHMVCMRCGRPNSGHDWTDRYPAIAAAAAKQRARSFHHRGTGRLPLRPDRVAVFDLLHRGHQGDRRDAPCVRTPGSSGLNDRIDVATFAVWAISSTPRIFDCCRSASARKLARLLPARPPASCSMSTQMRRSHRVSAPAGSGSKYRVEAAQSALPLGPFPGLDQGQEPGQR